jgi:putative transcriptional regulator
MDALLRRYKTILIAGLLMAACTARSQELDRPVILVASPELQGPYSRTALIAVPAASGQHIGFILNRATEMNLATVFPDHAPSAKVVDPVYLGGPEMLGSLFALVPRDPGVPGLRLFGEVFVVASGDAVDVVIEKMPNEARYLTGFVGWQAGELAKELESGYWTVTEPDAALIFSAKPGAMWEELQKRRNGI